MNQVLKFKIEIFDVRMRTSIIFVDDTNLVRSIQINKGTSLDNIAAVVFQKSKAYDNIGVENILKLYNYVKIEVEVRNFNPTNVINNKGDMLYFSGFIQTINKSSNFGQTPSSTVSITISDYANLMKTTFYTKNLTFLEILNQAVPEFRMINFSEYLGDTKNELLNSFYTPTQMGFIFFAFMFFKFMYRLVYDDDKQTKKSNSPSTQEIFKKFKIYMPFGFDITDSGSEYEHGTDYSMFKGQETSLMIYKQLQGVALDLFKYLYPEPIFEFTTYETVDSVILMIRLTPLMKFDRPTLAPKNITTGAGRGTDDVGIMWYDEKAASTQGYSFDLKSYNVIEHRDFGHNRIKSISRKPGSSPATMLKEHLNDQNILSMLSKNLDEQKNLKVEDLIATDKEANKITDLFFNEIKIDTQYLENLNMTRAANSVVNVIWTVPTTDTAVLKMSGREIVYAYMQQRLNEVGGNDSFGNYIYQQFNPGFYANPVFLMDYRKVFGQDFVSGDMNYFGFREFEIKWNYLSVDYATVGHILKYVDTAVLKKAKDACRDTTVVAELDNALKDVAHKTQQTTSKSDKPRTEKALFERYNSDAGAPVKSYSVYKPPTSYRQSIRTIGRQQVSKNKKLNINDAVNDKPFQDAMKRYGVKQSDLKNAKAIITLIKNAKEKDNRLMGGFTAELNSVIASAYRENEHLYDCQLLKPIDVSILPGMVVKSDNEGIKSTSPQFKGYVTSVSHSIDFNGASMKTNINLSRTASDDSAVTAKVSS